MQYGLWWVGKTSRNCPIHQACEDYQQRLQSHAKLQEKSFKNHQDLEKALQSVRHSIALDERAEQFSSLQLAHWLQHTALQQQRPLIFIIGGAEGLPQSILQKAYKRWSLSALTLPHRFAKLLVLEQLYRAHCILTGSPYHKA